MPLETKDVLTFLGIDAAESIDDFKAKFSPSFIRRDLETIRGDADFFGKLIGAKSQGTITAAKRALKKHGIKIEDAALEGKLEDVIETVLDSVATGYKGQIKTLEDAAGTGNDEKVTAAEKRAADAEALALTFKTEKEKLGGEFDTYKSNVATQTKTDKISAAKEKLFGGFKFATTVKSDLEKEGFFSKFEKKYSFDADETGNVFVTDKQGKKVANPGKADSFLTPEEALVQEGTAEKVYAINPHTPSPTPKVTPKKENTEADAIPADPRRGTNTVRPVPAS